MGEWFIFLFLSTSVVAPASGGGDDDVEPGKRVIRVPVYEQPRQADEDWLLEAAAALLLLHDP